MASIKELEKRISTLESIILSKLNNEEEEWEAPTRNYDIRGDARDMNPRRGGY